MHYDVPHILVGGNNGKLKGGRHLAYPTKQVPTGNLLLSILDQFDIQPRQSRRQHRPPAWPGVTDRDAAAMRSLALKTFSAVLLSAMAGAAFAQADIADAASKGNTAEVERLLKSGADVNAQQGDGATALHWAAYRGDAKLTERAAEGRRQTGRGQSAMAPRRCGWRRRAAMPP